MESTQHFEVIILGATFTAAGLAQALGERCLILERRPQAGSEFLNALKFGHSYDIALQNTTTKELHQEFCDCGAFADGRVCLLDCATPLHKRLQKQNVLLNTEIISVEKSKSGFEVTTHGVAGFRRWLASTVIDTRTHQCDIATKSLNALVEVKSSELSLPQELVTEKWGYENELVLKCPVSVSAGYPQARTALSEMLKKFSEQYRLIMTADLFDCTLHEKGPFLRDGVIRLPSCAYKNPLFAFDAGVQYGEEVLCRGDF